MSKFRPCRRIIQSLLVIAGLATNSGWGIGQQLNPTQSGPTTRTVRLSLIVTDHSNHSLDDVNKVEIQISEDKTTQVLSSFSKDERPVDYVIAIDNSGSFKNILGPTLDAAKILINSQGDADEVFVERFVSADKIETVEDFTSDKSKVLKSVATLYIEGGQSAMIDAVYVAVQHVAEHNPNPGRRHALVLFTDGDDRASYYTESKLFQLLREKDVQVFVIGVTAQLDATSHFANYSLRERAEKLLTRIAQETGGRVFLPGNRNELFKAATEVSHDLHLQYRITYESNSPIKENFHTIEIKIAESTGRQKLNAITRPGYYVNPPDSSLKDKKKKSN